MWTKIVWMRFSFVYLMYDVGGHRYRELLPWHPEELGHMIVTVGSTQPSLPFDCVLVAYSLSAHKNGPSSLPSLDFLYKSIP